KVVTLAWSLLTSGQYPPYTGLQTKQHARREGEGSASSSAGGRHDCDGWRRVSDGTGDLRAAGRETGDTLCLCEPRSASQLPSGNQTYATLSPQRGRAIDPPPPSR